MTAYILSFLSGILAVQQLAVLPTSGNLLVLLAIGSFLAYRRAWLITCLVLGIGWASLYAHWQLADRLPDKYDNSEISIVGTISSLPQQQEGRTSFDFHITKPEHDFPEKIHLTWYHPEPSIRAGQCWRFTVKLKQPYGRSNPGGFDFEAWLFARHIAATGYVRNKPEPELLPVAPGFSEYFTVWRQAISERMTVAVPNAQQIGMIKALSIGAQDAISQNQWEIFRSTGTTHLIVISGSHISLITGMVYLLTRRTWVWLGILSISPHKIAAILAWPAGMFYSGLAGYSIPTLRAMIMLSVALGAIVWQRHTNPFQILLLALLAVLAIDPLAVLSIGFWLSFLAVGLLIYVSAGRLGRSSAWRETIAAQLASFIGLSPLLIIFFQQMSLISPVANWLAAPLIGLLVVPLALLGVILLFVWPALAEILLSWADFILQGLWWLLTKLAEFPSANLYCLQPPWYALPLAFMSVLLILAPRGIPGRYLGVFLLLPLLFVQSEKPAMGAAWLSVLDVGQGLAAVVQTSRHSLVFDTGVKFSEFSDMGDAVVLPYLRWQGIEQLDALLISHGDQDHSGGAASLIEQIQIETVLSSAPEWAEGPGRQYCQAGQHWEWDQVKFTILSPPETEFSKENDNSCVLKVNTDTQSFLLTGDIELNAETWLAKQYGTKLNSTVLVAPHHGSKTSSTAFFLQQVAPELVIIPVGHLNRFGFPHRKVLDRYRELNLHWLSTAEHGAITVRTNPKDLVIESERLKHRHYWMSAKAVD